MESLLVPFPKEDVLLGKIIKLKKLTNKPGFYEVIIDVVNNKMLDYDIRLLEDHEFNYSPYFYFLNFTTNDEVLLANLNDLNNKGTYFTISLSQENKENNYQVNLVFISRMKKISRKYYFSLKEEVTSSNYFLLSEVLLENIIFVNDKNKQEVLKGIFKFDPIKRINFSIYHVGLGHASYFMFNEKDKGFYDIGFTKHFDDDKTVSQRSFNTHKPKWIILSHWDIEHYCGIVNYNEQNCFSIAWVAPCEYQKHFAFFRLLGLINKFQGKLYLIEKDFTGYNYLTYFYLFKGIGKKTDDLGLFIALSNQYNMMSLGDLDYRYLPKNLPFYDVDYLIIPDHGSLKSGICPFKKRDIEGKAIIPVGYNEYEYPNNIVLNILHNRGFKIHNTYDEKSFFGTL